MRNTTRSWIATTRSSPSTAPSLPRTTTPSPSAMRSFRRGTHCHAERPVILEQGKVLATFEVAQLGTVIQIAAPGIAERAHAGQFVHVRPGDRFDPLLRRPYSFNRIDRQAGEIELIVKALGSGGEWIATRRAGD